MNLPDSYTVEQKKKIASDYRSLMRSTKLSSDDPRYKIIRKAFEFAVEAHKDSSQRNSGGPYIHHPIEVAKILINELGLGTVSIVSALLHDTVEDTEVTIEDIKEEFDEQIAKIVDGLTKIRKITNSNDSGSKEKVFKKKENSNKEEIDADESEEDFSIQAVNFRKIIYTLGDDIRVVIIKLADRLHNMRYLDSEIPKKQHKIASETQFLYAPLAHRLGLYAIKTELEDLSMKYIQSELYKEIATKINQKKQERNNFINEFCIPIKDKLEQAGFKAKVYGRAKSIASIANKMKKQGVDFEGVYDLFAIRIVIDCPIELEKDKIWNAFAIVGSIYEPNPNRFRNWVANPKSNGYESLHTTVMSSSGKWVEVQIRSERMDLIAEKGLAAHFKYKEGIRDENIDRAFAEWRDQVRDIIQNPNMNPIEFMNEFRNQLFIQEIYVFTPKGDIKNLPKGSTALDFAFSIHTMVGSRCIGAKINDKLMPISHVLSNGDQIEILTSNKQKPNEGWLSIVFTNTAQTKIKQALKEDRKKIAEDGKEILARKLKAAKVVLNGENVQFLTNFFEMPSTLEFYYNIALDKIDLSKIRKINVEAGNFVYPKIKFDGIASKFKEIFVRKTKVKLDRIAKDIILFDDDGTNYAFEFANCCGPIPGDDVLGFLSATGGVKIHRADCKNMIHSSANYAYRVIKPYWTKDGDNSFIASLTLKGTDDKGLIHSITSIISNNFNVNIKGMNIETTGNVFVGNLKLFVKSNDQLQGIIIRLKELKGIISIKRDEKPEIEAEF